MKLSDIMAAAGLTVTPAREQFARFTEPYQFVTEQLIYRRGSKRPKTLEDIQAGDLHVAPALGRDRRAKPGQERAADTIPTDMRTDDAAVILLRYANGARGSVVVSQVSAGRKNSLQWEIDGSAAAAWWDSETPDHLVIGHGTWVSLRDRGVAFERS